LKSGNRTKNVPRFYVTVVCDAEKKVAAVHFCKPHSQSPAKAATVSILCSPKSEAKGAKPKAKKVKKTEKASASSTARGEQEEEVQHTVHP